MDTRKLANILLVGGLILLLAALFWWGSFYGDIMKGLGGKLSDALGCLYSSDGACGLATGIAQFAGKTPYSPALFWVGTVCFSIGALMKATLKS